MDKKALKKEFKKKWMKERGKGFLPYVIGAVLIIIGALIVFPTAALDSNAGFFQYPANMILYISGAVCSAIGLILLTAGEAFFQKQLKEYIKSQE